MLERNTSIRSMSKAALGRWVRYIEGELDRAKNTICTLKEDLKTEAERAVEKSRRVNALAIELNAHKAGNDELNLLVTELNGQIHDLKTKLKEATEKSAIHEANFHGQTEVISELQAEIRAKTATEQELRRQLKSTDEAANKATDQMHKANKHAVRLLRAVQAQRRSEMELHAACFEVNQSPDIMASTVVDELTRSIKDWFSPHGRAIVEQLCKSGKEG